MEIDLNNDISLSSLSFTDQKQPEIVTDVLGNYEQKSPTSLPLSPSASLDDTNSEQETSNCETDLYDLIVEEGIEDIDYTQDVFEDDNDKVVKLKISELQYPSLPGTLLQLFKQKYTPFFIHSALLILHSSFFIYHSSFLLFIFHSSFFLKVNIHSFFLSQYLQIANETFFCNSLCSHRKKILFYQPGEKKKCICILKANKECLKI